MRRALFGSIGILGCLFIASTARSQGEVPTRITLQNRAGELPFSTSIGTSVEHVDAATGALNVRIPIVSVPGRGMSSGLSLVFNSNYFVLAPRTDSFGNPYWIWTISLHSGWQTNQPYTSYASQSIHCVNNGGTDNFSSSYIYYDEDGAPHPRAVQNHSGGGNCSGITDSPNPDMTGGGAVGTTTTMTTADGTVIATNGSRTDSNGNQMTLSSTGSYVGTQVYTDLDTLGRTFFTSQFTVDAQNHPVTTTYTVHDSSGATHDYIVNWKLINYQTAFNNALLYGPEHELTTSWFVISSIQLPNGTSYTFKYDEGAYGEITEIDLPDGGVITYAYANLINAFRTRRYVASRTQTVNGVSSTWSFAIVPTSPVNQSLDNYSSTVTYPAMGTPPASSQSVFVSSDGAITDAKIYSGTATGTPLREYVVAYATDGDPYADDACYDPASNLPPLPIQPVGLRVTSVKTILENNQQSFKTYTYEPLVSYVYHPNHCPFVSPGNDSKVARTYTTSRGNVTDIYEYDWGPGAPGSTIRHTVNAYAKNADSNYTSRNIVDKITQQTVFDGAGNQIAQTQYEYDTTAITSTGSTAAQHDDTNFPSTFIYRGNVSRVKRWRNTDSALLSSVYTYDDLGNIRSIADPLTNTTSYSYADSFANASCPPAAGKTGQAFVSQITKAITTQHLQVITFPCTGLIQAHKDQNDINASRAGTTYTYDLFGRVAQKNMPDSGQASTAYTDIPPVSATTTTKITSTTNSTYTSLMDGLGRVTQTQLSDLGGTDYTDTTYDAVGRVSTKSNPHRTVSFSTDGITTYIYDALGRICVVIPPDGTMPSGATCPATAPTNDVFTTYSGNTTTVTDQAGKSRKSQADALGRLTSVWEDPAGLNYLTSYGYNSFGNLSSVLQAGSRSRTFTYNSLSELLTAVNPESGTATYTYDNAGNLKTKVAPAPNQTGAGTVTTTYSYDALNRNTLKTYAPATTPTTTYIYDQTTAPGFGANGIGRLVEATTSDTLTRTVFGYDTVGRISIKGQCIPENCSTGWLAGLSSTYDLMGNRTSYTNAWGKTFTQQFDAAGRFYQLTTNWIDGTHPATLAYADWRVTTPYYPDGTLRALLLWNNLEETRVLNKRLQPCRMNVNSTNVILAACADAVPAGNVLDLNAGFNLGVSDNGNIASWSATGNQTFNRTYTYDSLNRAKIMGDSAASQACKGLTWTYDAWGNRSDQSTTTGTCGQLHASVNSKNQLTDPVNNLYQYDAAGNMTHDASHSYTYDAENRVTAADGGATATYIYDAFGQRTKKSTPGYTAEFIYNQDGKIDSVVENTTFTRAYIYLDNRPLVEYADNTTYFMHQDHLGSTRLLTNYPSPTIRECDDYYPYGESNSCGVTTGTTLKFTGKERDSESGLDNFGARYMSSSVGRFMTPDWSAAPMDVPYADFGNPQSLNLYSYVDNNPLSRADADGHEYICIPCVAQYIATHLAQVGIGIQSARSNYNKNASKATTEAARDAAKVEARTQGPALGRAMAEQAAQDPARVAARAAKTDAQIGESITRTNAGVNATAEAMGVAGKAAGALAVGISAYNIATAPKGETGRTAAAEAGGLAGAIAGGEVGAEIGATIGSFFGPGPGTAIGAGIGGIIGAIGGGIATNDAASKAYDDVTNTDAKDKTE